MVQFPLVYWAIIVCSYDEYRNSSYAERATQAQSKSLSPTPRQLPP
jgi:hypothetical protein